MIGLIIGLAILIFGIVLCFKDFDFLGIIFSILSLLFLLLHIPTWLFSSYDYELTVTERNSIIETLEVARAKENNLELTAITKEIVEFNKKLAKGKYNNTTILDCYIDNRIMNLKPIK